MALTAYPLLAPGPSVGGAVPLPSLAQRVTVEPYSNGRFLLYQDYV